MNVTDASACRESTLQARGKRKNGGEERNPMRSLSINILSETNGAGGGGGLNNETTCFQRPRLRSGRLCVEVAPQPQQWCGRERARPRVGKGAASKPFQTCVDPHFTQCTPRAAVHIDDMSSVLSENLYGGKNTVYTSDGPYCTYPKVGLGPSGQTEIWAPCPTSSP